MNLLRVGFGGGCHWCTEAVFQALRGVHEVEQGFIASKAPFDAGSEAVIVNFDPELIPLAVLIEIHLYTHASTSAHKLRGKYRSAIYSFDGQQAAAAERVLETLQAEFEKPLVTQVLPFEGFESSDERFTNYYARDPQRPFCQRYIEPKLKLLSEQYGQRL